MSARLTEGQRMTVAQYLDWAERQPNGRFELVDGVPLRMSPERNRHLLVKASVLEAFRAAVRASSVDCTVLPDGATVVINPYKSREPDLSVISGASLDLDSMTVDAPVILVEVTSPSTLRMDTEDKLIEYFSLASVRHYVLVHPTQRSVVHHRRTDMGTIETSILSEGLLRLDPPGFAVEVEAFFIDLPGGKGH